MQKRVLAYHVVPCTLEKLIGESQGNRFQPLFSEREKELCLLPRICVHVCVRVQCLSL
jgi:hypothetical protein